MSTKYTEAQQALYAQTFKKGAPTVEALEEAMHDTAEAILKKGTIRGIDPEYVIMDTHTLPDGIIRKLNKALHLGGDMNLATAINTVVYRHHNETSMFFEYRGRAHRFNVYWMEPLSDWGHTVVTLTFRINGQSTDFESYQLSIKQVTRTLPADDDPTTEHLGTRYSESDKRPATFFAGRNAVKYIAEV